jgi:hypothetical protein
MAPLERVVASARARDARGTGPPRPARGCPGVSGVQRTAGTVVRALAVVLALAAAACSPGGTGSTPPKVTSEPSMAHPSLAASPVLGVPSGGDAGVPAFRHVYLVVFENREFDQVMGSPDASFLSSLAATYGIATAVHAEAHPSQPNYIALTSGGTQGVADDGIHDLAADSLFAQVTAAGRTWRAWQQGYPGGCFRGASAPPVTDGPGAAGAYVRKHDPAISYTAISSSPGACAGITGLAGFDPAAADLNFITPNLVNDMHDGSVADGDRFLRDFLPAITASPAFAGSVVFITWDEGTTDAGGGGRIPTLVLTPGMTPGFSTTVPYTHYSILRTIEDAWGLPHLGAAASAADLAFPW